MDIKTKILMLKGEKGDPGGAEWGDITGDITDQLDLSTSLGEKADTADLGAVCFSNDYEDLTNKPQFSEVAVSGSYNDLTDAPNLATVATSGSYTDLSNKPELQDLGGVLGISHGGTGTTDGAYTRRFLLFSGEATSDFSLNDYFTNYDKIGVAFNTREHPERGGYNEFTVIAGQTTLEFGLSLLLYYPPGDYGNYPNVVVYDSVLVINGASVAYNSFAKILLKPSSNDFDEDSNKKIIVRAVYGFKY